MERRIERGIDALFAAGGWLFEQSLGLVLLAVAVLLAVPLACLGSISKA